MSLPTGTPLITDVPFRHLTVAEILRRMSEARTPFTGYLRLTGQDCSRLLFFFQNSPYAAGIITSDSASALSVTDFCAQATLLTEGSATLSLCSIDPVLLKSLLVFLQQEMPVKTPVGMSDLERILQQIHHDGSDALLVLERGKVFNFFFFKDGSKTAAYWSDDDFTADEKMSVDDQMLLYALQPAENAVNAILYKNLGTSESPDAPTMPLDVLIRLFSASITESLPEDSEKSISEDAPITLQIVEGPQAGATLFAEIPCILGRKDADIMINDAMVSKRHASIQVINGRLMLMDLNSTNGTTLNGQKVTSQQGLHLNDRISIGQTTLVVTAINLL